MKMLFIIVYVFVKDQVIFRKVRVQCWKFAEIALLEERSQMGPSAQQYL
jgi:hypothetical protein